MIKQDVREIDENSIIRELTQRIEKNKKNLLLILDRWYYYNTILKAQIMFDYERHFGSIEIELRNKRKKARELIRKTEILERKQKNGEKINDFTLKIVDTIIKKEFKRIYKENKKKNNYYTNYNFSFMKNSTKNISHDKIIFSNDKGNYKNYYDNSQFNTTVNLKSFEDSHSDSEIPHLYRNIVKQIHPDIKGTSKEFTKYWYNVQDAYHSGDLRRLQLFNLTLCNNSSVNFSNNKEKLIYLKKQLDALKTGIEIGKKKIEQLRYEEPFIYLDKLKNKLWVAKRKKNLKEKLLQVNRTIDIKTSQLNRILNIGIYREKSFVNSSPRKFN